MLQKDYKKKIKNQIENKSDFVYLGYDINWDGLKYIVCDPTGETILYDSASGIFILSAIFDHIQENYNPEKFGL